MIGKLKKAVRSIMKAFKAKNIQPIFVPTDHGELLKDKIALISGGTGGIGLAIAKAFIASGASVILVGRKENKLIEAAKSLNAQNKVRYAVLDVTEVNRIAKSVEVATQLFPENRIDILVNSAGLVGGSSFLNVTEEIYDKVMDTNAKGTYFLSQAVSRLMIEKNIKGHILNVSSSSALRPAWGPYQMSKWAIRGLTIGMADELIKNGIVVNAIAPGPSATEMLGQHEGDSIWHPTNPAGRYVTPEEIANLAVFMVSGAGDMIVGDTFYITGGSGIVSLHK